MNEFFKGLNRLLSGCLFRHGNIVRERNSSGVLMALCERCNEKWEWWPLDTPSENTHEE